MLNYRCILKVSFSFFIIILVFPLKVHPNTYQSEKHKNINIGSDLWYSMWEVQGFAVNEDTDEYNNSDYNIEPTFINGLYASISSSKDGVGNWKFLGKYYSDYLNEKARKETESKSKLFNLMLSYGFSENHDIFTQLQTGTFEGRLRNVKEFQTEWIKYDILAINNKLYNTGIGLRYLNYSMPVEYALIDSNSGETLDHVVYDTETKGISIVIKNIDPSYFGVDNNRLLFFDGDVSFGISRAYANEFQDEVYGFQFNSQIECGIKKMISFSKSRITTRLGYRLFFDSQILSAAIPGGLVTPLM